MIDHGRPIGELSESEIVDCSVSVEPNWHRFSVLGSYFLFDSLTEALLQVDELLYELISLYHLGREAATGGSLDERYDRGDIFRAWNELCTMVSEGVLSRPGAPESDCQRTGGDERPLKALCLHVSHACNMACAYCFASGGHFGAERSLMSSRVAEAAVDTLLENSAGIRNLEVDFFGGEPLLNMQTVRHTVEYARASENRWDKRFNFTLTTNGLLLDESMLRFFSDEGFSLILSLDGRRETHDRFRKGLDGSGTYERTRDSVESLLVWSDRIPYYVRGTYTAHNLDFTEDIRHLLSLGIRNISVEPVVGPSDTDYALGREDICAVKAEYERLVALYVDSYRAGEPFSFFHFNLPFGKHQCEYRRRAGCGAGHQYMAVTPEGDLYPCHQFVGISDHRLGSVVDGDVRRVFADLSVDSKPDCRSCFARFLCSGGCLAASYFVNHDLSRPDPVSCAITRVRLEAALAAFALTEQEAAGE